MTNRREEVVYSRLRLGHTGLNDILQIIGKSYGLCTRCQTKEDVEKLMPCSLSIHQNDSYENKYRLRTVTM